MPKNDPWTYRAYKRRKRTKQNKDCNSVSEAELTEKSQPLEDGELYIGNISDLHLNNPVKKEYEYPDTRFQRSTTLFPAMAIENCLPSNGTSYLQTRLPRQPDTTLHCNDDFIVKNEYSEKTCEVISAQVEENLLPSETPCEISKRYAEEELVPSSKMVKIRIASTKTVEPTISNDVMILEVPPKKVKVEVIDLTDESLPIHPILCSPVRTSYLQTGLPGRQNTALHCNGDVRVKFESSEINNSPIVPLFNNHIQTKTEQTKSNEMHNEVNFEKSHFAVSRHADTATFRTPLLKYMNCNTKVDDLKLSHALPILNDLIKGKKEIIQIDLEDDCPSTLCPPSTSIPTFSKAFLHQILVNAKSKNNGMANISASMNPVDSVVNSNTDFDESAFQNRPQSKRDENMIHTSNANEKNSDCDIKNQEKFSKSLGVSSDIQPTQGVLIHPTNTFENPIKRIKICEEASSLKCGYIRTLNDEEYLKRGTSIMKSSHYPTNNHCSKNVASDLPLNLSDSSHCSSDFEQHAFTSRNSGLICSDTPLQNSSYGNMAYTNYSRDPILSRGLPALLRDKNTRTQVVYPMQKSLTAQSSVELLRRTSEKNRDVLLPSPVSGGTSTQTHEPNYDQSVKAMEAQQPLRSEKKRRILLPSPASESLSSVTRHNQSVEAVKVRQPLLSEKKRCIWRLLLPSKSPGSSSSMTKHNRDQSIEAVNGRQPLVSKKNGSTWRMLLPSHSPRSSFSMSQYNHDNSVEALNGRQPLLINRRVLLPSPASESSSSMARHTPDQSIEAVNGRQPLVSKKNRSTWRMLLPSQSPKRSLSMTQHHSVEALNGLHPLQSPQKRSTLFPSSRRSFDFALHNPD